METPTTQTAELSERDRKILSDAGREFGVVAPHLGRLGEELRRQGEESDFLTSNRISKFIRKNKL